MGCDVHLHTEIKISGTWHHYQHHANMGRGAWLFNRVAPYDAEFFPPRGVPEDCTELTRFHCNQWDQGGIAHSWFGAVDIVRLERIYKETFGKGDEFLRYPWGWLFNGSWTGWHKVQQRRGVYDDEYLIAIGVIDQGVIAGAYPSDMEDIRFVFWFDH